MIKVNTNNRQLLWQAIHNERQEIQQKIKDLKRLYERGAITEEDNKELDQLKEQHKELLEMEKSLEDILISFID